MHLKKLFLFPLFSALTLVSSSIESSAQTPTVTGSTNYVCAGGRLHASGQGFATNEYINVFVNGPRVPIMQVMTDSNGCFTADITYGGPYCDTNVQYRFNPAVEGGPYYVNAYYEAAAAPNIKGNISFVYSRTGMQTNDPMAHVRVTAHVGASGAYYDLLTSPSPLGPWKPMNMVRNNNTIGDQDLIWDFEIPQSNSGFFVVGKPQS